MSRSCDINKGANFDTFRTAIKQGCIEVLNEILWNSLDPNQKDENGWTGLHFAAIYEQPEVAKMLISHGADVNICAGSRCIPGHFAAIHGNIETLAVLLLNGSVSVLF
uniref:ANK_REP_REGION domain-containing protein n=1 Tax=Mesocestoides corti TaxID=53468 RepID=A0A5K3FBY7_MESCO